jgi:hypothetical protein
MTDITPSTEFLATAYSTVDGGWTRSFPWAWSRTKRDCFETIYVRGDKAQKVHVHRSFIKDATAAVFDINNQLRHADQVRRRAGNRRARAGNRQRQDQRAGATG